jgi:heterodisulfide reductase subunit B2
MSYVYYPGCALEGSAREYNLSTRCVLNGMGVRLEELDDWTCCGATAAEGVSRLLSFVLPARNLALAEKVHPGLEILVPCSACYLNLKKVEVGIDADPTLLKKINSVLAEEHLTLKGEVHVKHLLEVLADDMGPEVLAANNKWPLQGMVIAPYYGCQCLRPFVQFDDPEAPKSMDKLIQATGAQVFEWTMGPKCCGASHMNTKTEVGLELSGAILAGARGADAIATVCPMCQINLEGHQRVISRLRGEPLYATILYLPQVLGLSMGFGEQELNLNLNLAVREAFKAKAGYPDGMAKVQ